MKQLARLPVICLVLSRLVRSSSLDLFLQNSSKYRHLGSVQSYSCRTSVSTGIPELSSPVVAEYLRTFQSYSCSQSWSYRTSVSTGILELFSALRVEHSGIVQGGSCRTSISNDILELIKVAFIEGQ
jgi:hypothetical protein